ncbi:cell division protein FtsW [bacterium]|nr:cell division protein FtsW [FCB group bacterium]MBL7190107.1 cell division protein FtsW [bacterium]
MKGVADPILIAVVIILVTASLVIIFTASSARAYELKNNSAYYLYLQFIRVIIGVVFLLILSRLNYRKLKYAGHLLLIVSLAALIYILIPGAVEEVKGARRAIIIFGISFRPSELARFAVIIYLASSVSYWGEELDNWGGYLKRLIIILGIAGLIIFQPDLSTSMMFTAISLAVLYIGGAKMRHLLCTGFLLIPVIWYKIAHSHYQWDRIIQYRDSLLHPEKTGYQVKQSLIGLGDGGIIGLGLGGSNQKQFYLPEPFSDFVFSILGEEFGFLGTSAAIILFLVIAWRGIIIARNAPDKFGFILAAGLTTSITLYAFVNLCVVTGILPATGLPLPFLSYGGCSLIINLAMVGILLNISRQQGVKIKDSRYKKPAAKPNKNSGKYLLPK